MAEAGSVAHRPGLDVLGVWVDNVSNDEALSIIEGFIVGGSPRQVVTINPEFIITARRDAAFRAVLNAAHLSLPDGVGVLWAGRFMGRPFKERVTGVDTVQRVSALAARKGYRLFFLGAAPGIAARTAAILKKRFPHLRVVGTYAGSPHPDCEEVIVNLVSAARPDVLFVAYGAPQQDLWIARNLERLEVPVVMGVGGAFDFIAGVTRRAPLWMQRLGLEWLHRLWHEPWRWRRMLALPKFAGLVMWARWGKRAGDEIGQDR